MELICCAVIKWGKRTESRGVIIKEDEAEAEGGRHKKGEVFALLRQA